MIIKDFCDIHGEPICVGDTVNVYRISNNKGVVTGKVHSLTSDAIELRDNDAFRHLPLAEGDEIEVVSKYKKEESQPDMVNHPPHYQSKNGIEVIDVIEAFTEGLEGGEATNTGNVIKYILRWKKKKNPLEDLKKARWYIDRLIKIVEAKENVK